MDDGDLLEISKIISNNIKIQELELSFEKVIFNKIYDDSIKLNLIYFIFLTYYIIIFKNLLATSEGFVNISNSLKNLESLKTVKISGKSKSFLEKLKDDIK